MALAAADLAETLRRRPQTRHILPHRLTPESARRLQHAATAAKRRNQARRVIAKAAKHPGESAPRLSSIAAARVIADLADRVARLEQRVRELENPPALSRAEYIRLRTEQNVGPAIAPARNWRGKLSLAQRRPADPRTTAPPGTLPQPLRAAGSPPAAPTVPTGPGGAPRPAPRPDQ